MEGFVPHRKEDAEKYIERRWWAGLTLGDILDKAADIYPDHEALVDASSRLTYSQLRDKANRLAGIVAAHDVPVLLHEQHARMADWAVIGVGRDWGRA